MTRFLVLAMIVVLFSSSSIKNCDCCTEQHNQFDFWIGDWEVFDSTGNKVGENLVRELEDGCVIQENWKSKNMSGTSYNYYDKKDKTWNQLWIDNKGGNLILKGGILDGSMVMKDLPNENNEGEKVYNQISWSQLKGGNVRQVWELYYESGELKTELFNGIYKPKI
ncbi:MAG: hypothetical protein KDC92_08750 [Bacteroidetes bacterium]|nr:hypothetical protein [Bacteroidota bacterium]